MSPLFQEQTSSVGPRPSLEQAFDFASEGDVFVVTKLERLARSVPNMWDIMQRLQAKAERFASSAWESTPAPDRQADVECLGWGGSV